MNRKGFTLVELLAVVAIIAILMIMLTPGIIIVRNRALESTLQNRISQIENAAKDYGTSHINELKSRVSTDYNNEKTPSSDCIYRNVNFLISNGYINISNSYNTDDEGTKVYQLLNPVTGESMNNLRVCIRFDTNNAVTRKIIAYIVEEGS